METIVSKVMHSVNRHLVAKTLVAAMALTVSTLGFADSLGEQYATPLDWQISDESVAHGNHSISSLEKRLDKLNQEGLPSWRYHYVKAARWLDFARREHDENDRTGAVHSALHQSLSLIVLMEANQPYQRELLPLDTPQIKQSQLIREDLWRKVAGWKTHKGFRCAEPEIA